MARPKFAPNEEQTATLAALEDLATERTQLTDQIADLDRRSDALIAKATEQGIPVVHIAKKWGRRRKTVYRHIENPTK